MLKKLLKRFVGNDISTAGEDGASGNIKTNHQFVGLTDAVRSGWYLSDTAELVEGFAVHPEDVVLDVGCGDGLATHFAARQGAHVAFTDIDSSKVQAVREQVAGLGARKLEGVVSDTSPLPFPDNYATKILSMEMLEHTEYPDRILHEIVRVGKSGAQFLITVPDSRSEYVQKPIAADNYFSKPNHIQIFDKDRFINLVRDAGLEIESYRTNGFYWTIWWCLNWLVGKNKGNGPILDTVPTAESEILECWARVWSELLEHPGAEELRSVLNNTLPKSQAIVARKP